MLTIRPPFNAIVLNGDVTSRCEPDGFRATGVLVRKLVGARYVSALDQILFLPGNHDVTRDPKAGAPLSQEEREKVFRHEYRQILGRRHPSDRHLGVLQIYKAQRIALFGLDSCRVEGSDNPGIGFVGFDQLEQMARTLENKCEDALGSFRRLAFVHHHVDTPIAAEPDWLWATERRAFSFMADAARVREALLLFEIDFLFHGHYHTANLGLEGQQVISVGSVGGSMNRCTDKMRHFLLLELRGSDLLMYDFRQRARGRWELNKELRTLADVRPIQHGERQVARRTLLTTQSQAELKRYRSFVTAYRFFHCDSRVIEELRRELEPLWTKLARSDFGRVWAVLVAILPAQGPTLLERYAKRLGKSEDSPNLLQYLRELLKKL